MRLLHKLRAGRAEYQRRLEVLQSLVSEHPHRVANDDEPQPREDGTVVWLHVDDHAAWGNAHDRLHEMPWWSQT
jgi:hypothetical protein